MNLKSKIRTKAGDIFQIPIDEKHISFGQVINNSSGVLRIITFKKAFDLNSLPEINEILSKPILLLTDTLDAKIYNGDWKIYAKQTTIQNDLPLPNFKYGVDTIYITNYDNTLKRVATLEESENLDFKFSVSPIRIQNAMQAHFGIKDWESDFDKLTLKYCEEKSKIRI